MPSQQLPPPERMATRGVKITIPEEIQTHTREELREKSQQKAAEKRAEQERKKAERDAKQQKRIDGGKRIAALEDKQVSSKSKLYSFRPDLRMSKNSPLTTTAATEGLTTPSPSMDTAQTLIDDMSNSDCDSFRGDNLTSHSQRGRGRGRGTSQAARSTRGRGGRGTRGQDVHGTSRSIRGDSGRGGRSHSGHDGNKATSAAREPDMVTAPDSDDDGHTSDIDIPPATVVDTESEGAVDEYMADVDEAEKDDSADVESGGPVYGSDMPGPIFIDSDGDSEDDYQPEEEENKPKSKRAKAKVDKVAVRTTITAARKVQPQAPVQALAIKRKGSNAGGQTEHTTKRSKRDDIGGLDKGWQSVYGQRNASSTSLASSMVCSSDGGLVTGGEFDKDESSEVTDAARREKDHSPSTGPKATNVVLVAADVGEIDRKERGKKSESGRVIVSSKHLPLVNASDKEIWNNSFLPEIYNWLSTIRGQFSATSPSTLKPATRNAWNRWFSHLPAKYTDENGKTNDRVDHPAIEAVTVAALRAYRSDFAKHALKFTEQKMDEDVPDKTVAGRKAWATKQLADMGILYEHPGETKKDHRGLFKSVVVSQTLAWHFYKIKDSPKHIWFGHPSGTLALAAAAIKRALVIWKEGTRPDLEQPSTSKANDSSEKKKQAARNSATSFSQGQWGDTVHFYYDKYTSQLSDDKFEEIVAYAEDYMPEKVKKLYQSTQEKFGSEDELVMSD
ncbi:hypothetical protein K435DRAFT_877541 [Dendrothele bispora CBS 962.96]|uniref:DUF6532 domain-containing protein n=1 Tax=Dendrothele bispora (strain CBS 962.96) TaxID=1314807 RepID=A0A4S8KPP3_DENBC|nr:hypothetical protein K435DRAFT_877541 [Dendrothele bispora CBS 962.96]